MVEKSGHRRAKRYLLLSHAAFRALLQIRAVRKKPGALSPLSFSPVLAQTLDREDHSVSQASHRAPHQGWHSLHSQACLPPLSLHI